MKGEIVNNFVEKLTVPEKSVRRGCCPVACMAGRSVECGHRGNGVKVHMLYDPQAPLLVVEQQKQKPCSHKTLYMNI